MCIGFVDGVQVVYICVSSNKRRNCTEHSKHMAAVCVHCAQLLLLLLTLRMAAGVALDFLVFYNNYYHYYWEQIRILVVLPSKWSKIVKHGTATIGGHEHEKRFRFCCDRVTSIYVLRQSEAEQNKHTISRTRLTFVIFYSIGM